MYKCNIRTKQDIAASIFQMKGTEELRNFLKVTELIDKRVRI